MRRVVQASDAPFPSLTRLFCFFAEKRNQPPHLLHLLRPQTVLVVGMRLAAASCKPRCRLARYRKRRSSAHQLSGQVHGLWLNRRQRMLTAATTGLVPCTEGINHQNRDLLSGVFGVQEKDDVFESFCRTVDHNGYCSV